jgi:hypothetical protein
MFNTQPSPVDGQESKGAGAPAPATPAGGATPGAVATPNAQPDEEIRKKIEEVSKKYEDDIRKLKSTFDKRESERQRELAQREEEFNKKLREFEMRGMDEEARKKYEAEHREEEFARLAPEKESYQRQLAEFQQAREYEKFFVESGVSAKDLVLDQGLEALAESGWSGIRKLLGTLKEENAKLKSGKSTQSTQNEPEPVDVLNHSSKSPSIGSLADAVKRYANGDEDRFYAMIEKGMLSPSVLNLPKE